MSAPPFRLRDLPLATRVGTTCLLLVVCGGLVASAFHLREHHAGRDERPGFSLDDVRGAYAGITSRAPLLVALEAGHPSEIEDAAPLPDAARTALLDWLGSDRIGETYDDLDLGDAAPAELLAAHCLACHARRAADPVGQEIPLEYWDDVKRVAFSRDVAPADVEILLASTHTHALALGTLGLLLATIALATARAPRLRSTCVVLCGAGLALDLASWWLARTWPAFADAVVVGGVAFASGAGGLLLLVLAELWLPRGREHAGAS
ncbi:MAG: hypothetical protein H6825_07905 [Planctomycetes bacterium]|nr:hypothetical protein [Planctomycetota bacterium]